jgi:hypothetical protein
MTMKMYSSLSRLGAVLAGALLLARAVQAAEVEPGFTSLFNGTDLTGWEGEPTLWSVQDGAITGKTTKEHPAKSNTFLI